MRIKTSPEVADCDMLTVVGVAPVRPFVNNLEVSELWLNHNDSFKTGDIVVLSNQGLHKKREAILKLSSLSMGELKGNSCRITLGLMDQLDIREGDVIRVEQVAKRVISKVIIQRLATLKDGSVSVCQDLFNWAMDQDSANVFRIMNEANQAVFLVDRTLFKADDNLNIGEIRLSRYQRELLGLCRPENRSIDVACQIIPLDQSSEEALPEGVWALPDVTRSKLSDFGIARKLSDFIIGRAALDLSIVRPYYFDESYDVVRMSGASLCLPGIEEADRIIVSYGDNYVRARALTFKDSESVNKNNSEEIPLLSSSRTDFLVGIPAHLRSQLGVPGVNYSVRLVRDTGFLFGKHFSRQILPLAAFTSAILATAAFFFELRLFLSGAGMRAFTALLIVWLLAFIVFMLFADLRSRVDKKRSGQ